METPTSRLGWSRPNSSVPFRLFRLHCLPGEKVLLNTSYSTIGWKASQVQCVRSFIRSGIAERNLQTLQNGGGGVNRVSSLVPRNMGVLWQCLSVHVLKCVLYRKNKPPFVCPQPTKKEHLLQECRVFPLGMSVCIPLCVSAWLRSFDGEEMHAYGLLA